MMQAAMQEDAKAKTGLKEACVAAARAFIAEHGIEKLSLREVARELDVSHQAPYRHFENKDHLLAAVIARCFREFAIHLDERRVSEDPREELRSLGEQYVSYAAKRPLEYRLMFGTPWPDAAEDSELIRDSQRAFDILRGVLRRVHGEGKHARERVDLDAMFIWSNMHGIVTIAHSDVMRHMRLAPKVERKMPEHVFEMISAAMDSRREG